MRRMACTLWLILFSSIATAADGNRLAYLDGPLDPYYPHRDFPKLITPQWVGEEGVECVVTLAIDDMRDSAKYEAFLRPILDHLKKIDGRAAVSIMSCRVQPDDPQLQAWLKEGLSIEVHTYDHPCPCLQDGGLVTAKETYDKCVDLMNQIPGNKPVAFRMPCCDSKNTPSPRFWAEVFNKTTEKGHFLQIDSSVFNIITNKDKELPKEITELPGGEERFRRYVPFANFVNTIEDYPYPYIIGGMCWEFPCVVPSDWSAQHVQKPNNPDTVRDWKLALDASVIKQGTFNLVFHPHGWIKAEQIVELIDHAVEKHGKKVKFLTFKECADRLNRYTSNKSLRALPELQSIAAQDSRLRMVDVNGDGRADRLYSDHERYSLSVSNGPEKGLTKVFDVVRGKEDGTAPVIPPFVRADGTNNGAWFHSGALWLQNEDTWRLPDNVFKLTFEEMLAKNGDTKQGTGNKGPQPKPGDGARRPEPAVAPQVPRTQYLVLSTEQESKAKINEPPSTENPKSLPKPHSTNRNPQSAPANPQATPSSDARYDTLEMPRPLSPDESLKALHVRPGMKVELVAAEPLIVDPVAFDWGPDGRLWVVEMRDYPSGISWNKEGDEFGKPGGRVKVLTDVDGDGRYDKAALFLDDLPFPTGIKVWRKGILVTAAPDILYAEDTDGDDRADEKRVLYRGFGEGNQQHRVNGLRWGLDNWLHVGNGDSGGIIKSLGRVLTPAGRASDGQPLTTHPSPLTPPQVNVAGRDLRIRPDTGELEATSGNTQFGRETDDWGNWFGNNNSDPLWHYVLDDRYLRRNPHATYPPVKKQVSAVPGAAPVYPKSKTLARFNDDNKANRFTSACGPTIYRDDLLGSEFYGNSFVCEPVHNLVHREIISPQGATFTSRRADDEKTSEFLASEDSWFRPSMCRTGPDGALWVSDMYRFVIEHPKWIPPAAQKKLDMRAGDDKGRIYRIYPEGKRPRPIARLDQLDTAGLVAALDSPNGPQRDLAHQMLIWNSDEAAVEQLYKLAAKYKRPQTRLQALSVLEGIRPQNANARWLKLLSQALGDEHPAIRRQAIRIAERELDSSPELASTVLNLASDPDIQVRIQVAYAIGAFKNKLAGPALGNLLVKGHSDRYLTAAALSSLGAHNMEIAIHAVLLSKGARAELPLVERLLNRAAGLANEDAIRDALDIVYHVEDATDLWRIQALALILDAAEKHNGANLRQLLDTNPLAFGRLLAAARTIASTNGPEPARIEVMRLLGRIPEEREQDTRLLADLMSPQQPAAVQSAAAAALLRVRLPDTAANLLRGWATYTPALRNQVVDGLASREDWSLALLDAVNSKQVPANQFDARRRQQFLTARSKAVRDKAQAVLAGTIDTNRQKLVESYLAAASASHGDVARGKTAFGKRCANCHKLEGAGHAVGPDLSPLTHKPIDYLLTSILDPNRAVEDRYLEYVALTTDGRQLSGILLEETGVSLTLAAPEGKQVTLRRGELEQIKSSGKSLMPEGIERDVPPEEMTDILAYLKNAAPPPKQLALNQPEIVQPFTDGSIRLFATNCRAYGPTIKMEETWRALGWWNSQQDHCAWSFDVPAGKGGEYRVTLEYSCDDKSAGNTVVVEVGGQTLTGTVGSTGGWDKYRGWNLGTLKLADGRGELVVRSSGPIQGALFDLGGIRLLPVK